MNERKFLYEITKNHRTLSFYGGGVVFVFAFLALTGLQSIEMFGYVFNWETTQFNTALGLFGISIAIVSVATARSRLSLAAAIWVCAIGGLTLSEHLTGINLGIDELFRTAQKSSLYFAPGRMAFSTAWIFCLAGISLLTVRLEKQEPWSLAVTALFGGVVSAGGLATLFSKGFAPQFHAASIAHMPSIAAFAFLVAGGVVTFLVVSGLSKIKDERYRVAPLLMAYALTFVVLVCWQYAIKQDEIRVGEEMTLQASTSRALFEGKVDQTVNAFGRYASRVSLLGMGNKKYLELDSSNYLNQLSSIRRIGITDEKFRVIWSYPKDISNQVIGYNQTDDKLRREAFIGARDQRRPFMSRAIPLKSGEVGTILPIAMFQGERFQGTAYATLSLDRLFKDYIPNKDFGLRVTASGQVIYDKTATSAVYPFEAINLPFQRGYADWQITVYPTIAYVQDRLDQSTIFILIVGETLCLLGCFALQGFLKSAQRHKRFLEREELAYRRLNVALSSGKIAAFSLNLQTGEVWRSQNHDRLFGHAQPLENWTQETFMNHIPAESVDEVKAALKHVFVGKDVKQIEVRIRRDDDKTFRWLRIATETSIQADGTPFFVEGTVTDVTDEKTRQIEKDQAENALSLAYDRLERVIQASGEGIWERDLESREVRYFDEQCSRMFGFELGDEVTFEAVAARIHPDDMVMVSQKVIEHREKKSKQFEFEFRVPNRQKPLESKWIRARGHIKSELNEPDRLVSTLRDVTEEVRARQKLERALLTAEEAVRVKASFLASMSHEIRTPLNGIIGMTDLLLDTDLTSTQRNFAMIAQESGSSLLTLINDILDFSKIEAGKMDLEDSEINVAAIVENQIEILTPKAQAKGVTLVSYISPTLPPSLRGDAGRLGQILLNLIGNSLKFTKTGGVSVSVEKCVKPNGTNVVRFEVKDTGIGLAPEALPKLFTPFTQADTSIANRFGGTGLGLSICKQIIEAMDGAIGVESTLGVGSNFWFEVPLLVSTDSILDDRVGWEKLFGVRTLVVDPDPHSRDAIHKYVLGFGMRNGSVSTTDQAMERLWAAASESDPYRLVLLSGATLVQSAAFSRLISEPRLSAPKLVFISEFGIELESQPHDRSHYSSVTSKPVRQSRLLDSLVIAFSGSMNAEAKSPSKVPATVTFDEASHFRILVADDVAVNRLLTERMLDFFGYRSISVANGLEVLEVLKQSEFDLILMDCQMPEMDGFEATKVIRASNVEAIRNIPIIALTANAMKGDEDICLRAGMNDYLTKPMKKENLAAMLQQWLGSSATKKAS
jgi:signal transduction histidine kinase/CheY-like chemotaxis protein/sensor domain CHASE-containing protein